MSPSARSGREGREECRRWPDLVGKGGRRGTDVAGVQRDVGEMSGVGGRGGGERRGLRLFFCVRVVGERRIWVCGPCPVRDPYYLVWVGVGVSLTSVMPSFEQGYIL